MAPMPNAFTPTMSRREVRLLSAAGAWTSGAGWPGRWRIRSEEHTSELQSPCNLVCRLLLDPAPATIYTLSLHDALPILDRGRRIDPGIAAGRKHRRHQHRENGADAKRIHAHHEQARGQVAVGGGRLDVRRRLAGALENQIGRAHV